MGRLFTLIHRNKFSNTQCVLYLDLGAPALRDLDLGDPALRASACLLRMADPTQAGTGQSHPDRAWQT